MTSDIEAAWAYVEGELPEWEVCELRQRYRGEWVATMWGRDSSRFAPMFLDGEGTTPAGALRDLIRSAAERL